MSLLPDTAARIAGAVRAGEVQAVEIVRRALDAIDAVDSALGAFVHVAPELALERARLIDARRDKRRLGALAGVPVAIKDNICTAGMPTTCASRILAGYAPPHAATAVSRLEAQGAIVVGKTNLDEFAMGSSGENASGRATVNPWDPARVPGGSSSGSAAAVAAGLTPVALGSDTGGSVRQPGSFCGVVGVKPTYGRVSRYGLVAFASSLDQIGVLSRDIDDARLTLRAVSAHDPRDSTSRAASWPGLERDRPRLGVPRRLLEHGVDPGVRQVFDAALAAWTDAGAELVDIELPDSEISLAAYYIISGAEASSNLARYDGVRYGAREAGESVVEMIERTRGAGLGAEVKRRIMVGTFVLSSGYYDAYYRRAQRARALVRRTLLATLQEIDAIVLPTAPTVAFAFGEHTADPLSMYLADVFTVPASLGGLPAMSVPAGFAPDGGASATGMPVGVQLIGRPWEEETLFTIARSLERATSSALRPQLSTQASSEASSQSARASNASAPEAKP